MDANGLLTVLAILVAGYSLLSDEKRLDIRLRISWLDWLLVSLCIIAILSIIYMPVIKSFELMVPLPWLFGFNEETTIFACLLVIIIFFWFKVIGSRIPRSNYPAWVKASDRLLREKKLSELGYLFNKYHVQLLKIAGGETWYMKLHRFIHPPLVPTVNFSGEKVKVTFYRPAVNLFKKIAAKLLPIQSKNKDTIGLSISRILKSKQFVAYLAEAHPMVAARSTCVRFRDNDEFITTFFVALISHSGSPLYRELRDNQSSSYTGEYYLDESNALLNYFLKDVYVACKVSIWKPIGDFVAEFIQEQRGADNYYNQPCGYFPDGEERWSCPIFIGSLFFEVMVSLAIFQRKKTHCWLMYCDKFIKEILESLNHNPDVDKTSEFPSRFDYLLYEIFSACNKWVGAVEHLDYTDVEPAEIKRFPEYWATKTFGSMLRKIIKSDKLSDSQKAYFLTIAVRRMQSLDQSEHSNYSRLILDNCVKEHRFSDIDKQFIVELQSIYRKVDHVLKSDDSTFETHIAELNAE